MLSLLHKSSAFAATALIATFWTATALSELFLPRAAVVGVKTAIPFGFLLLIPAMAAAGFTGFRLAKGRKGGVIGRKRTRMPIIALNGALILVPSAVFLSIRARAGEFDSAFAAVQAIELLAGAANLVLLGLNIRDGRRMTAGRRRPAPPLPSRPVS